MQSTHSEFSRVAKLFVGVCIFIGFCLFLVIGLVLPPFGGQYKIPSMAMAPTLLTGDIIYASNYGYTFSNDKHPARGDVITFRPNNRQIYVKRVIGIPGDTIQMRNGELYLNGSSVERKLIRDVILKSSVHQRNETAKLYNQSLPLRQKHFSIFENNDSSRLDNTKAFNIPEGHVFVLGDYRDNSYDSRVRSDQGGIGMVPIDVIIGEVKFILRPTKSCKNDEGFFCPERKRFQKL